MLASTGTCMVVLALCLVILVKNLLLGGSLYLYSFVAYTVTALMPDGCCLSHSMSSCTLILWHMTQTVRKTYKSGQVYSNLVVKTANSNRTKVFKVSRCIAFCHYISCSCWTMQTRKGRTTFFNSAMMLLVGLYSCWLVAPWWTAQCLPLTLSLGSVDAIFILQRRQRLKKCKWPTKPCRICRAEGLKTTADRTIMEIFNYILIII